MYKKVFLFPLLFIMFPAFAAKPKVYTYTDSHGNIAYANTPPKEASSAEQVKAPPLQTVGTVAPNSYSISSTRITIVGNGESDFPKPKCPKSSRWSNQ